MSLLESDYTTVAGQVYACLSIVGPDSPQKCDKYGIKIRGCFGTREEAASHAKRLQRDDSTFDIYVVDMYKWLLIPPDPTKIDDVHYTNDKLEEIMSGYRENQVNASRMFEERKRDMMEVKNPDSKMAYIKPGDENSKYYSKPDEAPASHPADVLDRLQKEKPDASIDELVKEADEIVALENKTRQEERNKKYEDTTTNTD